MLASLLISVLLLYLYRRRSDRGTGASSSCSPCSCWQWAPVICSTGSGCKGVPTPGSGRGRSSVAAIAVATGAYLLRVCRCAARAERSAAGADQPPPEAKVGERRRAQADLQTLAEVLEQRAQNRTAALEEANPSWSSRSQNASAPKALRSARIRCASPWKRRAWACGSGSSQQRGALVERAAALFGMALQQFDGSADTVMRMVHRTTASACGPWWTIASRAGARTSSPSTGW